MNTKHFFFYLIVAAMIAACSHKEKNEQSASAEWKELESFHNLMAAAFHPLKDSGNVEPATLLMDSLANEAAKWAAAPLPEKVNNEDVKAKLEKLKTDLRTLANDIKDGAPEDQIGTTFYDIHEQFHHIMEAWSGEKEEKEHEGK
jgi:hypothetical protein